MWINVYPNWKMNFNSKNCRKTTFSYETKHINIIYPIEDMCLWCLVMKKRENIMWIHAYLNWKTNFNSKNGRETSFSYETKALISFILMSRVWLWCPILKRKEIIMWIYVYPNWKTNIDSKSGRERSFSYETNTSKSFITIRRMCL